MRTQREKRQAQQRDTNGGTNSLHRRSLYEVPRLVVIRGQTQKLIKQGSDPEQDLDVWVMCAVGKWIILPVEAFDDGIDMAGTFEGNLVDDR